jgi:predicted GIY-YIG superfamily endonuclease
VPNYLVEKFVDPTTGEEFEFRSRPWARREARAAREAERHPHQRGRSIKPRKIEVAELAQELASGHFDPRGYFVYLLYADGSDTPFYVGQSRNLLGRLGTHIYTYGARIARLGVIRCETRSDQARTEAALIREHQPAENIIGVRPRRSPDRDAF